MGRWVDPVRQDTSPGSKVLFKKTYSTSVDISDVFKFIDFGEVRGLVKNSSSLSPEKRAEGTFVYRACTCTASFLLPKIFKAQSEFSLLSGLTNICPLIGDMNHYLSFQKLEGNKTARPQKWSDFLQGKENLIIMGLWQERDLFLLSKKDLKREERNNAWDAQNNYFSSHNRFLQDNSLEHLVDGPIVCFTPTQVYDFLLELLNGDSVESIELKKDNWSVTLVKTWISFFETIISLNDCIVVPLFSGAYTDSSYARKAMKNF